MALRTIEHTFIRGPSKQRLCHENVLPSRDDTRRTNEFWRCSGCMPMRRQQQADLKPKQKRPPDSRRPPVFKGNGVRYAGTGAGAAAAFFSRCGARSTWLAVCQARSFSG